MNTLEVTINGPTETDIQDTAIKIGKAFYGEDKDLSVAMEVRALQTSDGQIRTFVAEVTITIAPDVQF